MCVKSSDLKWDDYVKLIKRRILETENRNSWKVNLKSRYFHKYVKQWFLCQFPAMAIIIMVDVPLICENYIVYLYNFNGNGMSGV